jgi:hypothetical protein
MAPTYENAGVLSFDSDGVAFRSEAGMVSTFEPYDAALLLNAWMIAQSNGVAKVTKLEGER